MLLCRWKFHAGQNTLRTLLRCRLAHTVQRGGALVEQYQQRGDTFFRTAPAYRQQVVVHQRFFVRSQPGDVEPHRRLLAVQVPQRVAVKHTQAGSGEHHHAVCCRVAHLLLHTDEVAGKQEVQDLATAVAQRLETVAPALQQRVQPRVGLALVDQGVAFLQHQFAALELLHQREFFLGMQVKERQGTQRAIQAWGFCHQSS